MYIINRCGSKLFVNFFWKNREWKNRFLSLLFHNNNLIWTNLSQKRIYTKSTIKLYQIFLLIKLAFVNYNQWIESIVKRFKIPYSLLWYNLNGAIVLQLQILYTIQLKLSANDWMYTIRLLQLTNES